MAEYDSRYKLTLDLWASRHVPRGARVTEVDIRYDDGYVPTFTDRPASLSVVISYVYPRFPAEGTKTTYIENMEMLTSVGELLTALFTIEERELSDPSGTMESPTTEETP